MHSIPTGSHWGIYEVEAGMGASGVPGHRRTIPIPARCMAHCLRSSIMRHACGLLQFANPICARASAPNVPVAVPNRSSELVGIALWISWQPSLNGFV